MKRTQKTRVFLLTLVLIVCEFFVFTQETRVQILDPSQDGLSVQLTYTVKGNAVIPPGSHLWVLARREDFEGLWWPQGEGLPDSGSGNWRVAVNFGQAVDVGWRFDICVLVVSATDHIILRDYRINAMKTGDWRPIEAPPSLIAPVLRKVVKTGH